MDFIYGYTLAELSLLVVIVLLTVLIASGIFMRLGQSTVVVETVLRFSVIWSGMRVKYVDDPDSKKRYFYAEKGQFVKGQSTMILLPGLSVHHYVWATIVQRIPSRVHVVAVDFPGHGNTPDPPEGESIGYKSQVKHVREFLALLKLDKQPVHVAGISMGASTAGIFASEYPDLTSSVSMLCPSMKTPIESHMVLENKDRVMADGGILTLDNCPILPQNAKELKKMFNECLYFGFLYPEQILTPIVKIRTKKNDFNLRVINEILSPESNVMLEESCSKIVCPSQVIWGKEDRIVHPSGAELLKKKLANCKRMDVVPECGHGIHIDKPALLTKIMLEFWTRYKDVSAFQ